MMERNVEIEKLAYDTPTLHLRIAEFEWAEIKSTDWVSVVPKMWHYHKETEIVLILQGDVDFFIDEEIVTLTSGDAVLIGSGQIHSSRRNLRDMRSQIVCHFDLQHHLDGLATPYFPHFYGTQAPLSRFNRVLRTNKPLNDEIFQSVLNIRHELASQERGFDLAASLQLKHILLLLVRNDPSGAGLVHRSPAMLELRPVIEYVNQHLGNKISVRDMSELCNMSYHYF